MNKVWFSQKQARHRGLERLSLKKLPLCSGTVVIYMHDCSRSDIVAISSGCNIHMKMCMHEHVSWAYESIHIYSKQAKLNRDMGFVCLKL